MKDCIENTIWEDKNGSEYTPSQLTDKHIFCILRFFDMRDVDTERARMLDKVIELARERGINRECVYEEHEATLGDGYDDWADND